MRTVSLRKIQHSTFIIQMVRVAIFDDNKSFIDGMKILLMDNENYFLSGTFPNAIHATQKIARSKPDVVIMDIKMPEVSGIQAVSEIKAEYPKVQILMQTVFEDDNNVFAAICAGASGYLLKGTPPDRMLAAIQEVYEGGSPMSPQIARKVLGLFQNQFIFQKDYEDLTEREKDILRCLVDGLSYKMIADKLIISYHTVNAHIRKIYEKLHVNSSQEAISKALKQKLV
jgi:DNA-binding NarL/FixJ family response regulator